MAADTVLIADDERSVRESLAKVFGSAGYETFTAADGEEAVRLHELAVPDIVLLDLNMPVKNGWGAFEEISTLRPLTPFVIITGRPGQFELAAAARVGALMEKPLDVALLLATARRLIDEPVEARLSRLAVGAPETERLSAERTLCGDVSDGPGLAVLRALRKRQLADLRSGAGTDGGPAFGLW